VTSGGSSSGTSTEAFVAAAADPSSIKITVVGTGISAMTDGQGRFRLVNVPAGDLQLAFERSDIDAQAEIQFHLDAGKEVQVDGEGWIFDDAGTILALEIEAKPLDDDDDDGDDDDADGQDFSAAIDALDDLIQKTRTVAAANGLNGGQINSLTVKLDNAIKSLERGDATPAINQIGAYINQVEAFARSGRLANTDAADLVADADDVIRLIQAA